jgi:hypothetical protein
VNLKVYECTEGSRVAAPLQEPGSWPSNRERIVELMAEPADKLDEDVGGLSVPTENLARPVHTSKIRNSARFGHN